MRFVLKQAEHILEPNLFAECVVRTDMIFLSIYQQKFTESFESISLPVETRLKLNLAAAPLQTTCRGALGAYFSSTQ